MHNILYSRQPTPSFIFLSFVLSSCADARRVRVLRQLIKSLTIGPFHMFPHSIKIRQTPLAFFLRTLWRLRSFHHSLCLVSLCANREKSLYSPIRHRSGLNPESAVAQAVTSEVVLGKILGVVMMLHFS